MGMMIIRHKVRDYGHWRPLFDGHAEMQKAAGLTNPRVYHSADSNKSEIVVVFDTKDTNSAKAFAASDDLKKAMSEAGVLDTPTVYFLESDRLKSRAGSCSGSQADAYGARMCQERTSLMPKRSDTR